MTTDFNSEIQAELSSLGPAARRRVLEYVRSLKRGDAGTPGIVVADFAGAIPLDDLQLIQTAIENGCEQVDLNEW
jgi:hypothetical protein